MPGRVLPVPGRAYYIRRMSPKRIRRRFWHRYAIIESSTPDFPVWVKSFHMTRSGAALAMDARVTQLQLLGAREVCVFLAPARGPEVEQAAMMRPPGSLWAVRK
jgi:hypothetical protein